MSADPFADIPLSPDVLNAANAVRDRMTTWIDTEVTTLKTQMAAQAANAASQTAAQAQQNLNQILSAADTELKSIESNLAGIQAAFTDPGLKAQAARLQAAIDAHQAAIAAQTAQLQQFGKTLGGVIQKALVAAL